MNPGMLCKVAMIVYAGSAGHALLVPEMLAMCGCFLDCFGTHTQEQEHSSCDVVSTALTSMPCEEDLRCVVVVQLDMEGF